VSCSRHGRAGPILSPMIPGCFAAGDQDPSRFEFEPVAVSAFGIWAVLYLSQRSLLCQGAIWWRLRPSDLLSCLTAPRQGPSDSPVFTPLFLAALGPPWRGASSTCRGKCSGGWAPVVAC
jgi:hypothetical protein